MSVEEGSIWVKRISPGMVGRFARTIRRMGYRSRWGDHTLFLKHSKEGKLTALLLYVNDIIVTRDDTSKKKETEGAVSE